MSDFPECLAPKLNAGAAPFLESNILVPTTQTTESMINNIHFCLIQQINKRLTNSVMCGCQSVSGIINPN